VVIAANRDAVAADKANARVVFRASATGHDAVASTVSLGAFRVEVDEPPPLGGEAKAPNPVEYYLASLLDDAVRSGFQQVRLVIRVTGPETAERYRELQEAVP
jgi:hypothetical protein